MHALTCTAAPGSRLDLCNICLGSACACHVECRWNAEVRTCHCHHPASHTFLQPSLHVRSWTCLHVCLCPHLYSHPSATCLLSTLQHCSAVPSCFRFCARSQQHCRPVFTHPETLKSSLGIASTWWSLGVCACADWALSAEALQVQEVIGV